MQKFTEKQAKTFLYIGGTIAVLVLLFIVTKNTGAALTDIAEGLGIKDTKSEKKIKDDAEAARLKFLEEAKKTSKATRTAAQWKFVADNIYNALKSSFASDNKTAAYNELARVLTDYDMALLIQSFGTRQEYSFGVPIGKEKSLTEFVSDNFSTTDISDLNTLYSRSKMKFKF